jgi:hypothetical protein
VRAWQARRQHHGVPAMGEGLVRSQSGLNSQASEKQCNRPAQHHLLRMTVRGERGSPSAYRNFRASAAAVGDDA